MDSNLRRKDLSDKAGEKLTPDSQKSLLDKTKEGVTNTSKLLSQFILPDSLMTGLSRPSREQRSARYLLSCPLSETPFPY